MRDNMPRRYYAPADPRPMGPLSVVLLSVLSSTIVTVGILYKTENVQLPFHLDPRDNGIIVSPKGDNVVEMRVVPSVLGLPTLTALELLNKHNLYMVVKGKRQDATAPEGIIIEQNPVENSEIEIRGEVGVTVSTGPAKIRVPDIEGVPLEAAKKIVNDLGLSVGKVSTTVTDTPGMVEKTLPPPGTLIKADESINLIVGASEDEASAGPKEEPAT